MSERRFQPLLPHWPSRPRAAGLLLIYFPRFFYSHLDHTPLSSVHFERLMGPVHAHAMLREGFKPTAHEALDMRLAGYVVPHSQLLPHAQSLAEQWIAESKPRAIPTRASRDTYLRVNALESRALADAFMSAPFLRAQQKFLAGKGKSTASAMFWALRVTRPLWSKLM